MTIGWAIISVVVLALTAFVLRRLHQLNEIQLEQLIAGEPVAHFSDVYPCPRLPRWHRRTSTTAAPASTVTRYAYEVRRYGSETGGDAAPMTPAAGWTVERERPFRDPSPASDVTTPALQALITASVAALLVLAVAGLGLGETWRVTLRWAGLTFPAVLAASWLWRLGAISRLLTEVETLTGADINRDGVVGDSEHGMLVDADRARATAEGERAEHDRAATVAELLRFVDRCEAQGCSEKAHGVKPNTTGRGQFVKLRDTLVKLGVARWQSADGRTAGWEIPDYDLARRIIAQHVQDVK